MVQPDQLEWRHLGLALLDGQRATRVKAAAGGRFGEIGRSSLEHRFGRRITDAWQGGDQMGGVGMPWCGEERAGRPLFHEPPGVHDADAVGAVGVHAHVVGDEHHGRPHQALHIRIIASTSFCTTTSSAVVGSSAMTNSGWHTVARAIVTRWRIPPDSWCG